MPVTIAPSERRLAKVSILPKPAYKVVTVRISRENVYTRFKQTSLVLSRAEITLCIPVGHAAQRSHVGRVKSCQGQRYVEENRGKG